MVKQDEKDVVGDESSSTFNMSAAPIVAKRERLYLSVEHVLWTVGHHFLRTVGLLFLRPLSEMSCTSRQIQASSMNSDFQHTFWLTHWQ